LTIDSIFNNFKNVAHGYVNMDRLLAGSSMPLNVDDFRRMVKGKKKYILKTHSHAGFPAFKKERHIMNFLSDEILPDSKIIYVLRDGKDVLVSFYSYLKFKGITYPDFTTFLKSKSTNDREFPELNRVEFLKKHLQGWLEQDKVLHIKFEEINNGFERVIKKIAAYIELPLRSKIKKVPLRKYSKLLRGVRKVFPAWFRTTAILPGKGKAGHWNQYFSDYDLEYFNSIMKELPDA